MKNNCSVHKVTCQPCLCVCVGDSECLCKRVLQHVYYYCTTLHSKRDTLEEEEKRSNASRSASRIRRRSEPLKKPSINWKESTKRFKRIENGRCAPQLKKGKEELAMLHQVKRNRVRERERRRNETDWIMQKGGK